MVLFPENPTDLQKKDIKRNPGKSGVSFYVFRTLLQKLYSD
jgi:hypothetical protein